MHIPTDLNSWLAGIPWNHLDWHEVQPGHNALQLPFTIKPNSELHELAHLIHCRDEHVLDPLWGLGPIPDDDAGALTSEQLAPEMEVITIQDFIYYRLREGNNLRPTRGELNSYMSLCYSPWYHADTARRTIIDNAVNATYERWTVEKIYAELQRKVQLVQSKLTA